MKKIISLILCALFCILPINLINAEDGYIVIKEPVYNMADSFYSNVTKISKDSLWGICDTNGYLITGYRWEAMGKIYDELIPAKSNGLWGYISYEGEVKIPYQFQKADNFSHDLARVLTADGQYAYINRLGEIAFISPFDYSYTPSEGFIAGVKDSKYGYCDMNGNIVIHPQFDMGFDFYDGLASVKFGEKWGYISGDGAYVVTPSYNYASDFSGGFAVCSLSSGYGIIDTSGKRTSPFTFEYIGECDEKGRFPAKQGGVSGYINSNGEWIMKLDYDFCYSFTDGVARVFKNNLWGYIDETGKEIVPPTFFDCGEYRNGRAFYSLDGMTYGFLTLDTENYKYTPITPSNPAGGAVTSQTVGTYEEIIDVNDLGQTPAIPSSDKTISMKIGSPYALRLNDAKKLTAAPALIDGVTMVPLRDIVEYMGGELKWESEKQRINISFKSRRIIMSVGSKIGFVDGIATPIASAPVLIDGVTMIPVRSAVTALGCKVEWIGETQNIYIRY